MTLKSVNCKTSFRATAFEVARVMFSLESGIFSSFDMTIA